MDDWPPEFDSELFAGRRFTELIPMRNEIGKHVQVFNLNYMNVRVYDPMFGRFLSPDPVVQFPGVVAQ
ncbi:MAG: hypothetical protein WD052_04015 [Bacteroidales bacterium]